MSRYKFLLCVVGSLAFMFGYGAVAKAAYPSNGVYGRGEFNGYRLNIDDHEGEAVLRQVYWGEAIRPSVNGDVEDFISFILNTKLDIDNNGSSAGQDERGATFIIQTMIGAPVAERYNRPTTAQINEWKQRVRLADSKGWITWRTNYSYNINSLAQGYLSGPNPDDDAFYGESGTKPAILFRDGTGKVVYAIKWECANPVGVNDLPDQGLQDEPTFNYNLNPQITAKVNGAVPAGGLAEEGDSVSFTYAVANTGPTASQSTTCTIYGRNVAGSYNKPASPNASSIGYSPPSTGCPRIFNVGTTTLTTETIASAPPNTTICRSLFVNPNAYGGVPEGTEVCVRVVSKPYFKVYGGDVSAGGGIATAPDTCTNNNNAAISTWNKRGGGSYGGAGVQYAAFALATITDFASAQAAGTSAAAPTGLSFANTSTNVTNGNFGGTFGSAPCITDYYALKPSSTLSLGASLTIGVSPLSSGDYSRTGPAQITGGEVNPGDRMVLYIDGDVYISGNITYPGGWTYDNIPSFKLVVRGDIFIGAGVTQLDGIYIAQPDATGGGTIYTCSTGSTAIPLSGSIYSTCDTKLTVNGSFVAKNVELLRTKGTLSKGGAGEASGSANIAEVFNYSPALWIPQSGPTKLQDGYDAITSLPPVL